MVKLQDVNGILNRVLKKERQPESREGSIISKGKREDDFWSPGNSDVM